MIYSRSNNTRHEDGKWSTFLRNQTFKNLQRDEYDCGVSLIKLIWNFRKINQMKCIMETFRMRSSIRR
jgi:hypothetical protein